jgi:glycosyltransferase involved in cell wall biosynthesis
MVSTGVPAPSEPRGGKTVNADAATGLDTPFGRLDGVHIIRFGQYDSPGGAAVHLRILNRELARRHRVTIHQFYRLTGREEHTTRRTENYEKGRIHTIPLVGGRSVHRPSTSEVSWKWRVVLSERRALRRTLRRMAIIATLGDNVATDVLRRAYHWVRNARFLPELIDITARFPISGPRARRLIRLRQSFVDEIEPLLARIGDDPVVFVNHALWNEEGAVVTREAHRRGLAIGIQHHSGWPIDTEIFFWWSRRHAHKIGGVYTRGLEKLLGRNAVDLGNGIDTAFFDPTIPAADPGFRHRHPAISPDALLVLAVGTISERKRQLDIVEASRILYGEPSVPSFQVLIIGETKQPEYARRIRDFVERHGMSDRVLLIGHLRPHELRDAYREAHVGVLASRMEGRPRVLLEMGAMGLPVVATDVDATRETFLPGRSGTLVPPRRPDRLADAMRELLTDASLRRRFGDQGKAFVRSHYGIAPLVERHVRFYLDILATASPGDAHDRSGDSIGKPDGSTMRSSDR